MIVMIVLTIMLACPLPGLPGLSSCGNREVYAAGGTMGDCGENLSTVYGVSTRILSIQVKDKSNSSRSMFHYYSSETDYPWHSVRSSVKEVSINAGVESIGAGAFKDMTSLTEVYIPKSMIYIYGDAFKGCTNLSKVYYGGSSSDWQTLEDYAKANSGNDPLIDALTFCEDVGEKTYDFRATGGGTYEYSSESNNDRSLRNTFAILENNKLITWDKEYSFSNYIDLNRDGKNDIQCHFSNAPSSYSLSALQTSDLMGTTYTFEIDKDMDLLGIEDSYGYYSKVTFIFPPKFNGDEGSFTVDLVNNKGISSEEMYCLGMCLNAAKNTDSSIISHFKGPVTEVDLDKDGNIDLIVNAMNSVEKAETCSIKDTSFTVKISDSAKNLLNNMEEHYYSTVIFKLAEPEKPKETEKTEETGKTEETSGTPYNAGDITPEKPVQLEAVEKAIIGTKNENDQKGSTFSLLQARGVPKSKSSIKLSWKKVNGATKYVIYGNKCGKGNRYSKLGEVASLSFTQKKLKKGTYYKYVVVAVGGDKVLGISKTIHVATKGGKVGNNTNVKVSKTKLSLKKGKSKTIKATLKAGSLNVKIHRKVAWKSSNVSIAKVNKKGKITGVEKGTCYVYAYAQNGVCAKVIVTVK